MGWNGVASGISIPIPAAWAAPKSLSQRSSAPTTGTPFWN